MTPARTILLDPGNCLEGSLGILQASGGTLEVLRSYEPLLEGLRKEGPDAPPLLVIFDGEERSGLPLDIPERIAGLAPRVPPVLIAVIRSRERSRAWLKAGANSTILWPIEPEDLEAEADRWLRFAERLRQGLLREEALRKFFSMYAHDLKNPLGAISGYCDLAICHPKLPPETREDLVKVRRNVDLLNAMAQGLLEMIRGPSGLRINPRTVAIADLLKEVVEMLKLRASSRNIAIRLETEAATARIWADPSRLIEALANVLDNAIKFSPEGSRIQVVLTADSSTASIHIDDEGPGIPTENREQIFERFTRASTLLPQGNLGLGLSIARDIIELHRGKIWAEPRSPRGTRISIRIPLRTEPETAAHPEASGEAAEEGGPNPSGPRTLSAEILDADEYQKELEG